VLPSENNICSMDVFNLLVLCILNVVSYFLLLFVIQ